MIKKNQVFKTLKHSFLYNYISNRQKKFSYGCKILGGDCNYYMKNRQK